MHGERKWYISTFFESFSRPFYKTDDARAYFVDQWDWMHSFNFGNSLKPTAALVGLNCFKVKLVHPIRTDPLNASASFVYRGTRLEHLNTNAQ